MQENWIAKRARLSPRAAALHYGEHTWTFAELNAVSITLAAHLHSCLADEGGVTSAHIARIGILAHNSEKLYATILACMNLGIEMVLLNARLSVAELAYQVADADLRMIVCDPDLQSTVESVAATASHSLHALPLADIWEGAQKRHPHEAQAELLEAGAYQSQFDTQRVMTIMYTSGTTGAPKGVMASYGNHMWSALAGALNGGLLPTDAWINAMPLFHVSGLSILVRSLFYGSAVYLFRKFDARAINHLLLSGTANVMSVVPYMLQALIDDLGARRYPSSFRYMLLGGSSFSNTLLERSHDAGIPVIRSYGMTETCSQIVATSLTDSGRKYGTSGLALFPNQLRIGEGTSPSGTTGDIQITSPALCIGYLNKDEAYRSSFTSDGWYKTGDIGEIDDDGYLTIHARLTDLIISGGENIYPAHIEQRLLQHPAISQAAVVGHPDERWGAVPWAYIVATPSVQDLPSDDDLTAFVCETLARYKVPARFIWLEELPQTSIGKIQKFKLLDP